jgi:AcrR family transcriptional regulator
LIYIDPVRDTTRMNAKRKKRVSRDQWLEKALEHFSSKGESGLNIEELARALNVAKSGFYFHFKDRDDLLQQLLAYWTHEYTEVVTQNPLLLMAPAEQRLIMIATYVFEQNLTEFEAAMQVWSNKDPKIAARVTKVVNMRRAFVGNAFKELGFTGDDLTARARIFLGYIASERQIFGSRKEPSKLARELLVKLLVDK